MNYIIRSIGTLVLLLLFSGCKKYLDEKPDKHLVIPTRVEDLQGLLDDNTTMNNYTWGLSEASADDYYLTTKDWSSLSTEAERNMYIWGDEVISEAYPNWWSLIYGCIYNTNVVLDYINAVNTSTETERNTVKGMALFFRADAFYKIASVWANAYDEQTADKDAGIPLRLSSDFNIPSTRSTVRQTYQQIIGDLKTAIPLLPINPGHVMRPSKAAAYGLLGRVLLSMRQYNEAGLYADSSLQINSSLMNFNDLQSGNFPIGQFNKETLFYTSGTVPALVFTVCKIDSVLGQSYADDDLRKSAFFKSNGDGSLAFYGHYTGTVLMFTGVAVDEQYLIKAECSARADKTEEAMQLLNRLLKTRWKADTFTPLTAQSPSEALSIILKERRKELLMRDLRWMDIKRLNKEGAGISLTRMLNGKKYELPANSPKFALPLPEYILKLTGMQQNPR
ncbi:MAG TPA: RagB/SusD family nutrient uptake outer membrane protein [Niabella sp.]